MMKIIIESAQGTKKSLLARAIEATIVFADPSARVIIRGDDGWVEGAMPDNPTHEIITKNNDEAAV